MVALHPQRLNGAGFAYGNNAVAAASPLPALQAIQPRFGMGPRKPEGALQPPVPCKNHNIFWPAVGSTLAVALLASATVFGLLSQPSDEPGTIVAAKVDISTQSPVAAHTVAALVPPASMMEDDVEETGSITPRPSAAARIMPTPASVLQVSADPLPPDELSYNPDDEPMSDIAALDEARQSGRSSTASGSARTIRISSSARLRARPTTNGKVLTTLGKGTQVTLYGCKGWCEVESGGQRGYVYAKALGR